MKESVWKGNTNFSLERFLEQHRSAYLSMERCAKHIEFQLSNENTRIRHILEGIQCNNPEIQAAIAVIRADTDPNGKRNNFESMVAFLLPADPVAERRKGNNRKNANISSLSIGSTNGNGSFKPSVGRTGVTYAIIKPRNISCYLRSRKMN